MKSEVVSSNRQLLPCPFCNEVPELVQANNAPAWWIVNCVSKTCETVPTLERKGKEAAIAAWNKRPSPVEGFEQWWAAQPEPWNDAKSLAHLAWDAAQRSAHETTDGWRQLHRAVASWSAWERNSSEPDISALNKILAAHNPFDSSAVEPSELSRALHIIDEAGKLSDWINRARPIVTELMEAYARRIRTDCTAEDLAKEPWRCMEYIGAEELLRDQPVAVVEIPRPAEKASAPTWDCTCNDPTCAYCGPRLAQNGSPVISENNNG